MSTPLNYSFDVASLCANRNSLDRFFSPARDSQEGISMKIDQLQQALLQNDHLTFLPIIWSEKDLSRRLDLLRKNTSTNPLLLFELGLAEMENRPSLETLHKLALPYFVFAHLRMRQDAFCFTDTSVYPRLRSIESSYKTYMNSLLKRHKIQLVKNPFSGGELPSNSYDKVRDLLSKTISIRLPSPNWLLKVEKSENGDQVFPDLNTLLQESHWQTKRDLYAKAILSKIEKGIFFPY